jgi:NitT/TauT family transport system substrate-binding protein
MRQVFVMIKPLCQSAAAALVVATLGLPSAAASAQSLLRVGKAVPEAFSFVPLDVGIQKFFFKKHGLDIQSTAFVGDAKLQQAMTADSIDVALGSGPGMAFIVKGSPVKAIAAMAGPPLLLAIVVRPDGPKTAADLKGKKISVSTVGSLTYWLVSEASRKQGWGPKGIDIEPMGALQAQLAALKRGDIDGSIVDIATAFDLESRGEGRILVRFGYIKDFIIHVVFATDKVIASRPNDLRNFLQGWFETIAYMRTHKSETVSIAEAIMQKDPQVTSRTYDELMPMFSDSGRFSPAALAVLTRSFVEMGTLPREPDPRTLYTEAFLPKSVSPNNPPIR